MVVVLPELSTLEVEGTTKGRLLHSNLEAYLSSFNSLNCVWC